MQLKELLTVTENKNNKQVSACLRKKQMHKAGISMQDILNMKVKALKK